MQASDPFNLQRFTQAQNSVFATVLAELKAGKKRTHWMWYIFPQFRGLGHSSMAQFYGIGSLAEAQSYLAHPLLNERLILCTQVVLTNTAKSLFQIFGSPDDIKFQSSMTLFALATSDAANPFEQALAHWCQGHKDEKTKALISIVSNED